MEEGKRGGGVTGDGVGVDGGVGAEGEGGEWAAQDGGGKGEECGEKEGGGLHFWLRLGVAIVCRRMCGIDAV